MRDFRKRMRSRRFLVVSAVVGVVALAGTASVAYAVYPTDSVTVMTGCLTTSGTSAGNIGSVAVGLTPAKPCGSNQKLIHISGGTITSVTAGTGLTGGGSDGAVTLNDQDATYNGTNFATSGQDCPAHQFATGIDAKGVLKCAQPALSDLQGAACTANGQQSTLDVTTDDTTGAVSMTCQPLTGNLDTTATLGPGVTLPVLNGTQVTLGDFSAVLTSSGGSPKTIGLAPLAPGSSTYSASFKNLLPGTYSLTLEAPAGMSFTASPAVPQTVTVTAGDTTNEAFTITAASAP